MVQTLSFSAPVLAETFAPSKAPNAMSTTIHEIPPVVHRHWTLMHKMAARVAQSHAFLSDLLNSLLWSCSMMVRWWVTLRCGSTEIRWPTAPTALVQRCRSLAWFVKPRPPPAFRIAQPQHPIVERQVQGVGTSSNPRTNQAD